MGVHGLTTYLRENQASCSKRLQFSTTYDNPTTFVVDGWSFVYVVDELTNLPWVYGGENTQYSTIIRRVVEAWLAIGIKLHFVFDGPFPKAKFPTVISRINQNNIQRTLLFFRTSTTSRSAPRFLREVCLLPPNYHIICIQTLQDIIHQLDDSTRVNIHFADEEGDPFAVELAARLGGYVVGQDSDYVILNAEGYKGYIPMAEMVWTAVSDEEAQSVNDYQDDDDGFQTVVKSKAKRKAIALQKARVGHGIIPPDDSNDLQLTVLLYSPSILADKLQIPASLLPLLASLVGNDFTGTKESSSSITTAQGTNLQWLFFERQLSLSQRITRVATTLHSILAAALSPSAKGKSKVQVNSVMELIEKAVTTLMVRSPDSIGSGEKDRVVDRIVEATLQYAIPKYQGDLEGDASLKTSDVCPLHVEEECPLMKYINQPLLSFLSEDEGESVQARRAHVAQLYIDAYRVGDFDSRLMDVLNTGTFWCRPFLENPDIESVSRSIGRSIHEVCYSLLQDGVGLPERVAEDDLVGESSQVDEVGDDDDDELVDVVEEDSESEDGDPLAPLRGALQRLDGSDDGNTVDTSAASMTSRSKAIHSQPMIILEFVRRGTRFAPDEVVVPPLADILAKYPRNVVQNIDIPMQLRSEDERFTFFLQYLDSDFPQVRNLHPEQLLIVLSLRWVVSRMYLRARASENSPGYRDRVKEVWTKQEARAYLLSSFDSSASDHPESQNPPIENRSIQLIAQISTALSAIQRFSQILLLAQSRCLIAPILNFSGIAFHRYLTGPRPGSKTILLDQSTVSASLWEASVIGLDDAFVAEPAGKKKKAKQASVVPVNGAKVGKKPVASIGGRFGLLVDSGMP
ncbi:PIN domain-like protein [Abortiporus biennis]|nr:PIN domain-like protein [Abortiporus biennis]